MLFIIPLWVGLIVQLIKVLIDYVDERKLDFHNFFTAWGFPSVHSSIATSITTLMGLVNWIHSSEFAIALSFSLLFWYDAVNIRFEAWKHAQLINKLQTKLKDSSLWLDPDHNMTLKERLWHTVTELMGWIAVGFLLTLVIYYLSFRNGV